MRVPKCLRSRTADPHGAVVWPGVLGRGVIESSRLLSFSWE